MLEIEKKLLNAVTLRPTLARRAGVARLLKLWVWGDLARYRTSRNTNSISRPDRPADVGVAKDLNAKFMQKTISAITEKRKNLWR
ncbi:MAG: hypothetical protein HYZ65_07360 [Burkholderiales bacterium]|nr:hypothetical protein [Burkholderiales bacterium]